MIRATDSPIVSRADQALARWFAAPQSAQGADESRREAILADIAATATAVAVHQEYTIVRHRLGRTLLEPREIQRSPLMFFDHAPAGGSPRLVFWVAASDAATLLATLRGRAGLRVSPETILVQR